MDDTYTNKTIYTNTLEKIQYILLAVTAFLIPFFFIPSHFIAIEVSKALVLTVGVIATFFVFLLNVIKRGEFQFPNHKLFWAVLVVPVVFLLATIFGSHSAGALLGSNFDVGGWMYMALGFLLLFLSSLIFNSKEKIFYAYLGFLGGFVLVLLITISKIFIGGNFLTLGIMNGVSGNPVGNWTDLAAFFAAGIILVVMALEFVKTDLRMKIFLYAALALSLFALMVINFSTVWLFLLAFSLVFFVYIASSKKNITESGHSERRLSYSALALVIVSLIFFFNPVVSGGNKIGDLLSGHFGASNLEVRPSFGSTVDIISSTLKTRPILGTGPGTFSTGWMKYKPNAVNLSNYWNANFQAGFGLMPTFAVTTGILGILAWLVFFIFYIKLGIRALFTEVVDPLSKFFLTSSFFVSLFFWFMTLVYVPRIAVFSLGFLFSGLFVASALSAGVLSKRVVSFGHNAKLSFLAILLLIVLLVGNVRVVYGMVQGSVSNFHFQKAGASINAGDVDGAINQLNKAVGFLDEDTYYRALAQTHIAKVNQVIANAALTNDEKVRLFQENLRLAINAAKTAIDLEPSHYENYTVLGQIYESLVPPPIAIAGAYDNAKKAYEDAIARNPKSPEIYLLMARLEVQNKNTPQAREYIRLSLEQKNNYADAYYLLTQIELAENNLRQAIESAQVLAILSPNNPGVFFQLGLLKYNNKDYLGAKEALVEALRIVPEYANAQYFLGLVEDKLGNHDSAITQFETLIKANPDNTELKTILENLNKSRDPLFGLPGATAETRTTPPITSTTKADN